MNDFCTSDLLTRDTCQVQVVAASYEHVEDGHEEGHEEGVDVLQVVEPESKISAPYRDGKDPECCHASEIQGFCNMSWIDIKFNNYELENNFSNPGVSEGNGSSL